jgi:hypothetical protein
MKAAKERGRGDGGARATFWLVWSLWTLSLASAVVSAGFRFLNVGTPTAVSQEPLVFVIWYSLVWLSFATVGALVASRQPKNAIGWIFCALGVCNSLAAANQGYAIYALVTLPVHLPGGATANWLSSLLSGPIVFPMFALVLLLFPDGQPLSRRWRAIVWLDLTALVLILASAFRPGPLRTPLLDANNPFGIEDAGVLLDALVMAGILLALVATATGAVSLVFRLRRSRGDERQQLKWFAFAGAVSCAAFATGPVLWSLPPSSGLGWIWMVVFLSAVSTIPAAAGQESQLAIVASTLAIAALFNPLRRRVQAVVDRLFYRRKYDAAKTLEEFSAKLRDETDLDEVNSDLVRVVRNTMQPEHVTLWLREPERKVE